MRAQLRAGKSLYLLAVIGVALGVASVLAIQIINRNAVAAFRGSVRAVSGESDLTVVGQLPTFAESLYVVTLAQAGVRQALPIYRVNVAVADRDGLFLEIVGVDLFQPTGIPLDSVTGDVAAALRTPGWVAVTPELGRELGWRVNTAVDVTSGTSRSRLRVGALVDFKRIAPLASRKLAVMDIAQAQALFGTRGQINQIDVELDPGADRALVMETLSQALGPSVAVLTPGQREERAAGLMGAFRVNLTALSMISLFVGLFLVYASTQASLVRRRTEFGVLRSLGATQRQVFGLIALEVTVLGALGVAIGIPLGYLVAAANVDVVSNTLTNLYLLNEIEALTLPPWLFVSAAAIGIVGAVLGALWPSLDMSRRDPAALLSAFTLHERLGSLAAPLALSGVLVLVLTGGWYWLIGHEWQPAGFVLAIGLLVGIPLLTPATVQALASPTRVRRFSLDYAIRTLTVRLHGTSVAVAALAVAVSMLTGITVMVESFRRTVALWVETSVAADVYVTTPTSARSPAGASLDSQVVSAAASLGGVVSVDRLRGFLGYIGDRRVSVVGVDMGSALPRDRFPLFRGEAERAWHQVREAGAVLISEPLARKERLQVGDSVTLAGPEGPLNFAVAGVYYDYSTEAGAVAMDRRTLDARFGPGPINSVALYLEEGLDSEQFADRLRQALPGVPLLVRSNQRLRTEVMRIFDETFAITRVLQAMSLLIAVAGITLTLLVIARERVSELALYRSLGAVRHQIFGLFVGKGLMMGTLAIGLGVIGGLLLAAVLVFVINRRYFGWTIQVDLPLGILAVQMATILGATIVASIYPALRASRTPATQLSRDDL